MRPIFALLLTAALASAPAVAQTSGASPQPDEAHQLALSILEQTHATANMQKLLTMLRGVLVNAVAKAGKSQQEAGQIVDHILLPDLRARMGDMLPALAEIWAENLSIGDMRAVRDFYNTPAGQHLLAKQAVIAAESYRVGAAVGSQIVRQAIQRHEDELRKLGVQI